MTPWWHCWVVSSRCEAEPHGPISSVATVPSSQCQGCCVQPQHHHPQPCPQELHTWRHPTPSILSSLSPSAPQATVRPRSLAPQWENHPPLSLPSLPPNSHHSPGFDYGHKGALEEPWGSWREAGR